MGGAIAGALLLIPYYELPLASAFDYRFVGDCLYWLAIGGGILLIYALQQRAARAAAACIRRRSTRCALSKQMLEAQLQLMRAQIEPHFLFNTLANVQAPLPDGRAAAACRCSTTSSATCAPRCRACARSRATLGQEADLVHAYLAVLKIRMGRACASRSTCRPRCRASVSADDAADARGERHQARPQSLASRAACSPSARAADGTLQIRMADNGVGFGAAATGGTGVGLANTRARLAALHGPTAELSFLANEPTGVIAMIEMPLLSAAGAA
jgi:LytS/YehU family sensor histidine kinase